MRPATALLASISGLAAAVLGTGVPAAAVPSASSPPAGFQRVVDDTGTISVVVPEGWAVDTARFNVGHDGVGFPSITASPGRTPAQCEGCSDGWLLPMFEVFAEPYGDLSTEANCSDPETMPFDNGSFVGIRRNNVGCDAAMDEVLASEASGALNIRASMIYADLAGGAEPAVPVEEAKALFDVMLQEHRVDRIAVPDRLDESAAGAPRRIRRRRSGRTDRSGTCRSSVTNPYAAAAAAARARSATSSPTVCGPVTSPTNRPRRSASTCCASSSAPRAGQVISEGTANIVNNEPDYVVVNNNTRLRSAPAAPGIVLRDSAVVDGECVENTAAAHNPEPARQAWVRIDGGQVTWILWGCGFPAMSAAAEPANLPPAYPDYSDGVGSVWPYGTFQNVPQLGREPVAGQRLRRERPTRLDDPRRAVGRLRDRLRRGQLHPRDRRAVHLRGRNRPEPCSPKAP